METKTLRAHFDGHQILLDEPFELKEKLEAELIIQSLTALEHQRADDSLKRIVLLLLPALAFLGLVIVLLLGFGMITLPTAFVLAVITPLLSGVLALLTSLVRHISKEPNMQLIITVLPKASNGEIEDWTQLSLASLARAYGDDEPEYSLDLIKEANPAYEGR